MLQRLIFEGIPGSIPVTQKCTCLDFACSDQLLPVQISAMSSLTTLTDDLLKLVMQHVPLKDRLTCCCLVSRRLHRAAVAATDALQFGYVWKSPTQEIQWQTEPVTQWISLYGQHLTSLVVMNQTDRLPLKQLPCKELLELRLYHCSVQLGAADGQQGVIQGCTKLTCLDLWCCSMIDVPEGVVVDCLSSLVHLQHLVVRGRKHAAGFTTNYMIGGLSDVTLPRLEHLTHLDVHGLNDQNLLQLQQLTSLKHLTMQYAGNSAVGASTVPGLVFPASLQTLVLWSPVEAGLLSLVPTGLQDLRVVGGVVAGPAEGPGSLLSGMARLQHLTELSLEINRSLTWPPSGPAYSALTASSNLVNLELYGIDCPDRMWSRMFAAAHKLPHLTCLRLVGEDEEDPVAALPKPSWGAVDLSCLVSCCPSLREVWGLSMQPGLHVSELHKLPALQQLDAYFDRDDLAAVEESFKGLSAMTQLWQLCVDVDSYDLEVSALLPLTKLTNLGYFTFKNRCGYADNEFDLELNSTSQAGSASDVWLQLLEHCAADSDCQPTVLRSLAQQLAEQRALTAAQQQRAWVHEQHVVQQHQQIAGLQWQVSTHQQQAMVLQQHLSAQQQVATQQAAQIAGLQQQLQQVLQHLKQ